VNHFEAQRTRLARRRAELQRRLSGIETDFEENGARLPEEAGESAGPSHVLADFLASVNHELGQVECAIRRIDSREYDCCMQCGGTIQPARLELLPYAVVCDGCSRDFPHEYKQQLRGRHASLRHLLHTLVQLVGEQTLKCDKHEADLAATLPVRALLADLARELPHRFAREEEGGHLSEALAAAPRYSRIASRLREQHDGFRTEMDDIARAARAAGLSAPAWWEVYGRFQRLSLELLGHDEAENEILERAFLDDMGGAD